MAEHAPTFHALGQHLENTAAATHLLRSLAEALDIRAEADTARAAGDPRATHLETRAADLTATRGPLPDLTAAEAWQLHAALQAETSRLRTARQETAVAWAQALQDTCG